MLTVISHTDEAAKTIVEKFCGQVVWLLNVRRIYAELFEDEQSQVLMEKTASSFFGDLSRIMHGYLLLEFAKITDRAKTSEKENFTIDNLIESIEWPSDIREELKALRDKTKPFITRIPPARHKLLAHTDKETFLADRTLGEFPKGEDEVFLKTLQKVCDVTYKACFGTIFGQIITAQPGDISDLKGALEKAVAFDQLLSESSGQEATRLHSILMKLRYPPISAKGEALK
jgi:hypothetical protein